MQEILFRGKKCRNGEWVEGYYVYCGEEYTSVGTNRPYILTHDMCGFAWHEVIPETVSQYTGINDANGKRIYEGDILHAPHWWWGPRFVHLQKGQCGPSIGESVMHYILARYVDDPEKHATHNLWNGYEVEVIGNIHDNPELLQEGA